MFLITTLDSPAIPSFMKPAPLTKIGSFAFSVVRPSSAVRRLSMASFMLAAASASSAAQAPAIQIDWIQSPFNGQWYGVERGLSDWASSESLAHSFGGHLATIRSQAEQDWIEAHFASYLPGGGLWVGLNDVANEGQFVWASNEPVTYLNWNQGSPVQPDNAGGVQDFVHLGGTTSQNPWTWNDEGEVTDAIRPLIESATRPNLGWSWPQIVPTDDRPQYTTLGDFDGDGDLDLASPNGSGTATIHWNDGHGTFVAGQIIPLPIEPRSIVATDFDDDGDLDLVVSCDSGGVLVPLMNDQGIFTSGAPIDSGLAFFGLVLADVNSDGLQDLVASSIGSSDKVTYYLRLVGGGYGTRVVIDETGGDGFDNPQYLTAGDIDGDGDMDVVAAYDKSNKVVVYSSDGTGGFPSKVELLTGTRPFRVSLLDLDSDGDLDMAVPALAANQLELWFNDGSGAFAFSTALITGIGPHDSSTVDLNGDGIMDVVVPCYASDEVLIYYGDGQGGLSLDEVFSGHDYALWVTTGDVDGSGRPDLIVSRYNALSVAVFKNQSFADCNSNGLSDSQDISSGFSFDCDGNGRPDECDLAADPYLDINQDGFLDSCFPPALVANKYELSVAQGGIQAFTLRGPSPFELYFLAGSTTGTQPGIQVGALTVPLNVDNYTLHTFNAPGAPPLTGAFGLLMPTSTGGIGTASFTLPPAFSPTIVGLTLHHAFVTVKIQTGGYTSASNAVPLTLVP